MSTVVETGIHPVDPAVAGALAGDYRILGRLGSGRLGPLYLAEQIRVGHRKVALKVLDRRFAEDAEFVTRFQHEAASTGRISHPNVVTIYECPQAPDGTLYLAMEFVEGESLTERLRTQGRLPLDEVVEITSQCCKALQAAHRLGITHQDLNPDKLMLTRDMDGALMVKLLGFGVAKPNSSDDTTVPGSGITAPAYMSYEHASGCPADALDGRSDLYALGLVTYTMLAGRPPFEATTPLDVVAKHLFEAPPPLEAERPDLPPALVAAVMKALEKDRARRHPTAAAFAAALRAAVNAPGQAPAGGTADPLATLGQPSRPHPSAGPMTAAGDLTPAGGPTTGPEAAPVISAPAPLQPASPRLPASRRPSPATEGPPPEPARVTIRPGAPAPGTPERVGSTAEPRSAATREDAPPGEFRREGLVVAPARGLNAAAPAGTLLAIDDARRRVFLTQLLHEIAPAVTVAECRTILEGQWCAVSPQARQLPLPRLHIRRADIDGAIRGAAPAVRLLQAVLREHLSVSA